MAQQQKSSRQKKQPFPPKHYIATLDNLKSSEYPLPVVGPAGELACPEGYIATRPGADNKSMLFHLVDGTDHCVGGMLALL